MPEWLVEVFARYGYGVVFAGVLLENAGVPVPGETALLAGGALGHAGRLSLQVVIVTAAAAAIIGDNIGFLIGRRAGRRLAERHGAWVGLTRARLDAFDRFFERHGPKTIFFARFITGLRVFGAFLAGASDLGWSTFLFYNASGAVVWSIAVAVVGYVLADSWDRLIRWVGLTGTIALALFAALLIVSAVRDRK